MPRLLEQTERFALPIVVLIMAGILVAIAVQVHDYGYWRHDELKYLQSYYIKLVSEGRWFLQLLFPLLKTVPPFLAWMSSLVLQALFFYLVSRQLRFDRLESIAVALIFLASSSYIAQLNWPSTTLPGVGLLILLFWLRSRVNMFVFMTLGSILCFGVTQSFIYFLPIFYLADIVSLRGRAQLVLAAKVLLGWGGGYVAGYLFSQAVVFAVSGHFIELAKWRRPNYVDSVASLFENIQRNFEYFSIHFEHSFRAYPLVLALFYAIFVAYLLKKPARSSVVSLALVSLFGLSIAVAHYVLIVPIGVVVSFRTALSLYVGLTIIFLSLCCIAPKRLVIIAAAISIALPALLVDYQSVRWFRFESRAGLAALRKAMPQPADSYAGVILNAKDFGEFHAAISRDLPRKPKLFGGLAVPMRVAPALFELGFSKIYLCTEGTTWPLCNVPIDEDDLRACAEWPGPVCPLREREGGILELKLKGESKP